MRTACFAGLTLYFMIAVASASAQDISCAAAAEPIVVIDGVVLGQKCAPLTFRFPVIAVANSAAHDPAVALPPANPSDVESADAITAALYDVISGPAGQKRDWDRFRSLFIPGGRLIPARTGSDGKATTRVLTADEYSNQGGGGPARNSFYEREVSRKIDTFGSIMQRFSTYESRHEAADERPFARGINSIQLFNDGTRWWVVTVLWDSERPGNEIPEQYLTKPPRRLNP